jgi:hypothetical protein
MAKIEKILFLIVLVISFSCEDQVLFVNDRILLIKCADCTAEEPLKTSLEIKIDLNNYAANTIIKVYEGNLSDSILYSVFNASESPTNITVSMNKKYTVTATYYIPDDYYVAVDSAIPRAVYDKKQCNSPCYYVYDNVVDLRLKHTK